MSAVQVVQEHARSGRAFTAAGVRSFVRETTSRGGEPVVCVHGVPTSSFLWRKVLGELEGHGLHGVAFDLPGLGLADRPQRFDYTWTGLGRWTLAAIDALQIGRFHLVVHDIGGPVGFEVAAAMPERVRSLTVLNTIVEVDRFRRPWSMEPFARRGVGRVYLASLTKAAFWRLWKLQAIANPAATPRAEVDAYVDLLKRGDGGRAFLRIMRGFERTPEKARLYARAVQRASTPFTACPRSTSSRRTRRRRSPIASPASPGDRLSVA